MTAQASWQQKCWHLANRRFVCEADARTALERELKGKPMWLEVRSDVVAHPRHAGKGRPRKEASPTTHQWQIVATVTVHQQQVAEEALRHPPVSLSRRTNWRARHAQIKTCLDLQGPGWSRTWLSFSQRSAVPGLLGLRQESGAHHRPEFDHGPLLAGLSFSRSSAPDTPG